MSYTHDDLYASLDPDYVPESESEAGEAKRRRLVATASVLPEGNDADLGRFYQLMKENERLRRQNDEDKREALATVTRVRGERDEALADNDRLREQRDWAIGNSARHEQNSKDMDRRHWAEQLVQTELYLETLKKRLGSCP